MNRKLSAEEREQLKAMANGNLINAVRINQIKRIPKTKRKNFDGNAFRNDPAPFNDDIPF